MSTKSKLCSLVLGVIAIGAAAAHPASASATLITGNGTPILVGDNFQAEGYGTQGYIEFGTTAAGYSKGLGGTATSTTVNNPNGATTIIDQPSYVSAITGYSDLAYSGFNYSNITPSLEAGIVSSSVTSKDILGFTLGNSAPRFIQFGVLYGFDTKSTDNPASITLTGSGTGISGTISATNLTTPITYGDGYISLFDITNAQSGQTYTVSLPSGGYISGVAFAPEPSQDALLAVVGLGLGALLVRAKKRVIA